MTRFIAWLKAIFTRTKETNVPDVTDITADVASTPVAAASDTAPAAVDSGAASDAAAPAETIAVASVASASVATASDASATVAAVAETAADSDSLAEAVEQRVAAVLAELKDVLTYAKVEVAHVWDESVAFAKKLA